MANSDWVTCEAVCREGCEESEAGGDVEMWAEFLLVAALHALRSEPLNLDLVQKHTQVRGKEYILLVDIAVVVLEVLSD